MAELASPISGGINSARGVISPRAASGAGEMERQVERQQILSTVSNLVGGLNVRLDRITSQMIDVRKSLESVSISINQNSFLERQKEAIEQERERRIAEQQLREGQESLVERKIENALIAPVQKQVVKTQLSLSRLMGLFTLLLTSWLAPKIFEGIKFTAKLTLDTFGQLKNTITKAFASVTDIFQRVTTALTNVSTSIIRTVSRITTSITTGLFRRPFDVIVESAKSLFSAIGGKLSGIIDTGKQTAENAVGIIASPAESISNAASGLVSGVRNMFGGGNGDSVGGPDLETSYMGQSLLTAGVLTGGIVGLSRLKIPTSGKAAIAGAAALWLLGGDKSNEKSTQGFSMASEGVNLMDGRTSDASGTLNATTSYVQPSYPDTSSRTTSVGPAPEPKTNVIVTAGAQSQPNIVPASMNASGNKVPLISSSNPDNFYIYYSMANYNVVM